MSMRAQVMYNYEVALPAALVDYQFASYEFVVAPFRIIGAAADK
jgi:hypothetical protein